jgi:hypothetical protein
LFCLTIQKKTFGSDSGIPDARTALQLQQKSYTYSCPLDVQLESNPPTTSAENHRAQGFGSFADECLAVEEFNSLLEAQIVIADWRRDYNDYCPRSALGMLTPTEFAARQPQPTLS